MDRAGRPHPSPSPLAPWQPAQARSKTLRAALLVSGAVAAMAIGRQVAVRAGWSRPHRRLDTLGERFHLLVGQRPPLLCAKAGIGVPGRPSVISSSKTESGTIVRKSGSFSGGAGPSLPVGPVAARAVLAVQGREVDGPDRPARAVAGPVAFPGGRSPAPGPQQEPGPRACGMGRVAASRFGRSDHDWPSPDPATNSARLSGPRPAGGM